MAKSTFKIAYVARGKERLWRDFWLAKRQTDEVLAAHEAGELGRVEIVVAAKLTDAITQVERMHPNCTVMREGSARIGGA